ncbi:N-formylglutamate amidohydrolase [Burkholderia multivorans]|uniref:N-formylglutamate amidohydrolase n=1 Tax=Burkholderia multivorans TaxID=87883 RepID=UPI000CFF17BE|nr:N-formylglutamate amidohydrolase [Burkholderia multivorans]PRG71951.1 N-formylglutamate amidohydrolase [Burkholderia multivorans]
MQSLAFGHVFRADSPLVLVTPHSGSRIPADLMDNASWAAIEGRMADPAGLALEALAAKRGITTIGARYHPCVIDFNVATESRPLSLRLSRSGLCRTHTSRGEPLYDDSHPPSEREVETRVDHYWRPFHAAVAAEIARLRGLHANVLLLVSHASYWLSPYRNQSGALDCNIGSNRGRSCDRQLVSALTDTVGEHGRSWVVNGKVADVFAAQHYGAPGEGVHAVEMEIAGRWRSALEYEREQHEGAEATATLGALFDALEGALARLPVASTSVSASAAASTRAAAPAHPDRLPK